uniref:Protein kinase domain-containing protein n=1 Tax=Percolomonas cosmopolitus TaxID=63605 RepID=A0A7S1PHS2_9EUKA|mmetsp:Transcript_2415/g.9086  ORF Transcript_2415/g.9086 Transcript_2415/m.9086 type:complete len:204 (+) Transcript_2415:3-614(+)
MWAVGCICCELYLGKPMFRGSSTMNQLQRIVTLIGKPSNEDIARIPSEYAQSMLDSIPHGQLKDLKHCFPKGIDADALDFITKLLQFMPENRMTAEEALKHPYLKKFYKTSEEPTCEQVIKLYFNDNSKYTVAQYRDKLYQEIKKRRERRKTRTTDSRAGSRTGSSSTTTTTSSSGTRSVSRSGSSIGHRSTSSSSYARSRRS